MAFLRTRFTPTKATGVKCPQCGHGLTFSRSCLRAMLVCDGCGKNFDPADFVDQLGDLFEEVYANVPIDRM
jgi:uncharacterized protein (DUF983 family)